ncbi:MAG: hypothetical protein ACJAXA_002666 [Candidatus Aldehydirespiratoraceae bacterium]|jgi:hypothetical protein
MSESFSIGSTKAPRSDRRPQAVVYSEAHCGEIDGTAANPLLTTTERTVLLDALTRPTGQLLEMVFAVFPILGVHAIAA